MFFWQIPDLVLGKVRKNQRPSSHRFCAIAKTLRGGPPRPPPIGDRVKQAGAELGQAQLKLGMDFTSINLHSINEK